MVKKAVAGCIKINDKINLYAAVEGVVSGQWCCPDHLFISNPQQQYLHINNTHIIYRMPTPVRDSHCHSFKNISNKSVLSVASEYSTVVSQTSNWPPWLSLKHSNTSSVSVSCGWKQIQYAVSFYFFYVFLMSENSELFRQFIHNFVGFQSLRDRGHRLPICGHSLQDL